MSVNTIAIQLAGSLGWPALPSVAQRFGIAYANGSNQNLGLWNVFVTTTLKQTGPNHYVLGSCP